MYKYLKPIFVFLLCLMTLPSFAQYQTRQLISKPNGFKIVPPTYDRSLNLPGTPGVSDWAVAQWGSPSPLTAFYNGKTSVSSTMSRFSYDKNSVLWDWEMALNGDKSACGQETHLFATPTEPDTYDIPEFATVIDAPLANNGRQLIHTLNVKPHYYQQFASSCVTQGMFITSFVLKNLDDPYLTVFYQLTLHNVPVNPARNATKFWFFNGSSRVDGVYNKTWGYSDLVTDFGYSYPAKGATLYFNADLKPKLRAIITDSKNTIPAGYRNPDRWYVSSHYHGPHVWGGIRTTYHVRGFSFYEKWQYCSVC